MTLLVLLGCCAFLFSAIILSPLPLQIVLLLLFLASAFFAKNRSFLAYLVFVFIFPFLPSQLFDRAYFDYLQFTFLCFAFWWAFFKVRNKTFGLPSHQITPLLFLFVLVTVFSFYLVMLRNHFLISGVFLLKFRDNWNIFVPHNSADLLDPFFAFIHLLEGVLFFYITVDLVNSPERIERSARIIFYAAGIVSLIGLLQYLFRFQLIHFWLEENPNLVRINSTFSDPNSLGTYLAAVSSFGIFSYLSNFPKTGKLSFAVLLVMFLAMILTASRAASGSVFLAVLAVPVILKMFTVDASLLFQGALKWMIRYGIYVVILILFLTIFAATIIDFRDPKPASLLQVILFTFNPRIALNVILKGRLDMWGAAIRMFLESPLFGCGISSFGERILHAPFFLESPENTHNYFLQILAEGGLPSLILFLAILFQLLRSGLRRLKSVDKTQFLTTYGLFAGLIAFLLTSFTGHPLLLTKLQFVFWAFAALLMPAEDRVVQKRSIYKVTILVVIVAGLLQAGWIIRSRNISAYEYGYYPWERDEMNQPVRWTTSEAISVLEVHGKILELQIRQINPDLLQKPYRVLVYLDEQLLDTISLTDTSWKDAKYYLPAIKMQDRVKIRIVPESSFVPLRFGKDKRKLGVQLRSFSWQCSMQGRPIGVYEEEKEGPQSYYWTTGQASFPVTLPSSKVSFPVLPNASVINRPVHVRFLWNDSILKSMTLSRLEWTSMDFTLPANSSGGVLTIQVTPTANPARLGLSSDTRELGIRVGWPFRLQTLDPSKPPVKQAMIRPDFYAISNVGNWPFRIFTYSIPYPTTNFVLYRSGIPVRQTSGVNESIHADGTWTQLFHPRDPEFDGAVFTGKLRIPANLARGYWLFRITAKGNIEAAEVPLARLAMDDREIARQPILYNDWTDYYFSIELKDEGKELSIELVNDLYSPDTQMDRNLFIKELSVTKKMKLRKRLHPGWEFSGNRLLIAEPLNDRDFFSPQNDCYTIERGSSE